MSAHALAVELRGKIAALPVAGGRDVAWGPVVPFGHTSYTWLGVNGVEGNNFSTVAAPIPVVSVAAAAPASAAAAAAPAEESKGAAAAAAAPKAKAAPKATAAPKAAPAAAAAAAAAEPAPEASLDVLSELDFVVGKITACKVHEGADSLYVESIDVGAARGGERTIVSGLVKYVPLDKMLGASVVVVANLKPASLRKVTSYGMVLAAKSASGDVVLVQPPAGAQPGDRVVPLGADWSGKSPAKEVDGRKENSAWAVCAKFLATNDKGAVVFKGDTLGVAGNALTATVTNGIVS